jgi:ATP-dependent Clp protease ATP-binding subunit ClpA
MSWKGSFTDRAEDTLGRATLALKRRPAASVTAEILRAIEECGPSLARGVLNALDVNISEVRDRARQISIERISELPLHRIQARRATLEVIVRRATEEAELLGDRRVGTEHLLLAILSIHDDPTTYALRVAGVSQDTARGTLRRMSVSWTDDGLARPRASVA